MARRMLTPFKPGKAKPPLRFGVCDIESRQWVNFVVIGYFSKVYDKATGFMQKQILETFDSMSGFIDWIFSEEQPHDVIFAHYGGRFDFLFILKELYFRHDEYFIDKMIPRGSGFLSIKVSKIGRVPTDSLSRKFSKKKIIKHLDDGYTLIRTRTIEFRDSSAFLPFSLASITKNFGVDHAKKEIDYDKITGITDELIEYLEYDLKGLFESIEKYFGWDLIQKVGSSYTVASQSLKIFELYLKKPLDSLTLEVDQFVRSSYFGGRTEIFKPYFEQSRITQLLRTYDVNSLYPYILQQYEMPTKFIGEVSEYDPDMMGFYHVEVEVPDMYVPPLGCLINIGTSNNNRFIFPTGIFRGHFSSLELNYAMTLGVKIRKVFRGMLFSSGGWIFRKFIDDMYAIRNAAQEKNKPVDDIMSKLTMNALYGRMGLDRNREGLEFAKFGEGYDIHSEFALDDEGKEVIRIIKPKTFLKETFSNVAIAAWTTSGARIHMHQQYLKAPKDLYYTDTDSIKTTAIYPSNKSALGELKLEQKSSRACYLLPKTYAEETLSPDFKGYNEISPNKFEEFKTSLKIVMKGFDKRKTYQFNEEDMMLCLDGEVRLVTSNPEKMATLKTALSHNEFLLLLKESPREIRSRYNKRRVIERNWSQKYDTEPLHIKDGKIVNMETNKKTKKQIAEMMTSKQRHAMDKLSAEIFNS